LRSYFAPVGDRAQPPQARGFGYPAVPLAGQRAETAGPHRFLGNPGADMPCSSTPVGPQRQAIFGVSVLPSAFRDGVGSHDEYSYEAQSHGLSTRCLRFVNVVTGANARLASRLLASFAGRDWLPAGFLRKVSKLVTSHPPCPGFACRTTKLEPEPFD